MEIYDKYFKRIHKIEIISLVAGAQSQIAIAIAWKRIGNLANKYLNEAKKKQILIAKTNKVDTYMLP